MPIVLVGNKTDLDNQRVVHTKQGLKVYIHNLLNSTPCYVSPQFAQQNDMTFFETSCATAFNITNVRM